MWHCSRWHRYLPASTPTSTIRHKSTKSWRTLEANRWTLTCKASALITELSLLLHPQLIVKLCIQCNSYLHNELFSHSGTEIKYMCTPASILWMFQLLQPWRGWFEFETIIAKTLFSCPVRAGNIPNQNFAFCKCGLSMFIRCF